MKNLSHKLSVQWFNTTETNTEKKQPSIISYFQNTIWFIPGMKGLPNYNINNVLWEIDLDESSILLNKLPQLLAYSLKLFPWLGHQYLHNIYSYV